MVCAKCAKLTSATKLATPSVVRKSELYHGSSASSSHKASNSATQGPSGIGKSKLLSKSAKNPYAAYAASCEKCKVKVELGKRYCQKCAYKENGMFTKTERAVVGVELDSVVDPMICSLCHVRQRIEHGEERRQSCGSAGTTILREMRCLFWAK